MRTLRLMWLPAVAALLAFACAPVDDVPTENAGGAGADDRDRPPPKLPPVPIGLKNRIEAALENVHQRDLLTTNSFWTIFHGILGLGPEVMLKDPRTGKHVKAIDYICDGGEVRGLKFIPTVHGLDVATPRDFVGQGHQDQFVAEMAQWGMPLDRKFRVNGQEYTFADFVRHAQMRASVKDDQELSWAIIIVAQYRGTNVEWTNERGEKLHFEDIVRYELNQPIDDAACGGTHRLFGLTWAYHLHLRNGGKKEGVWADVAAKLEEQKARAKKFRNPDGSFSTRYLAGPGNDPALKSRIGATGHVLEWLALAMTDAELRQPWVQEAASALSLMILQNAFNEIDTGSLYHAAHGLHLYHARVFGNSEKKPKHLLIPLPPGSALAGRR